MREFYWEARGIFVYASRILVKKEKDERAEMEARCCLRERVGKQEGEIRGKREGF